MRLLRGLRSHSLVYRGQKLKLELELLPHLTTTRQARLSDRVVVHHGSTATAAPATRHCTEPRSSKEADSPNSTRARTAAQVSIGGLGPFQGPGSKARGVGLPARRRWCFGELSLSVSACTEAPALSNVFCPKLYIIFVHMISCEVLATFNSMLIQ